MSCSSLNQQVVRMTVSAGALPEGFCPESIQDMFDAMIQRIIVTPNQQFSSFAASSLEPSSNVGPWLKDCDVWNVWDESTSRYVEMTFPATNATIAASKPVINAQYLAADYDLTAVNAWQDVLTYTTTKPNANLLVTAQGAFRGNGDYASAKLVCGSVESQMYGGPPNLASWNAGNSETIMSLSLAANNVPVGTVVKLQIAVLGTAVIAPAVKGRAYSSIVTLSSGTPTQTSITYLNVLES